MCVLAKSPLHREAPPPLALTGAEPFIRAAAGGEVLPAKARQQGGDL